MNYEVAILPSAEKDLEKLPKKIQKQIDEKILALSDDPPYIPHIWPRFSPNLSPLTSAL